MPSEQLSQRLLASILRDDTYSLREIFSHELSGVSPSLFHDSGDMRKTNKAELMNEISAAPKDIQTDSAFHVIDGCALLYRIYWAKVGNMFDLYSTYKDKLLTECRADVNMICVVFDGYKVESTKGPEQKRRRKSVISTEVNVTWDLPILLDMKSFLASKNNKQQLIDLFSQRLLIDGIQVNQAEGDADMVIVREALSYAKQLRNVVVHSVDTDVFIAMLYHLNSKQHHNVIMDTKKGYISINETAELLTSNMRDLLPFAHAISGNDTVSATYGLGKLRAYKKLCESEFWRKAMLTVGNDDAEVEQIVRMGEKFYMELYGKLGKKTDSLDHLREVMYMMPKYIPISRMPPTSRAFRFHMLRTHLEVNTIKNLGQRLREEDNGYERNSEGQLIPIITDMPPAPPYLLKDIKCSCEKPNRAGLLCTSCSCSKVGLPCTLLCKCDGQCENE